MSLPPSFITPNPPLTRQVLPRKSVVESNKEKHHHEEEAPKTTAQRIAALGTGVLLTTAVNLLVQAENKLPTASQPKPSALLSTDVSSWAKSLGLLAGVQGINTGLGLQFPPIINALELGAVSHMLIPGTLGGKVAHFMTMAPLLIGSVGATQLAHGVIDYTVEQDGGLNSNEKKLTKSLLGFMVSIGVGVGAMALFPRIHIGLAGLGVKFQSKTATGAKASENWYITTVKTVDGWQFATGKAWEHVQAKLKNQWERTLKKGDEKPVANTQAWFDKKTFKTHAEVPWTYSKFYTEQPEKKLFALQKTYSQTLEVLPEPQTWQEKAMHWVAGKQSPVARAILATQWNVAQREAQPSQAFLPNGAFQQFEPFYKRDINHVMGDGQYCQKAKVALIEHLEETIRYGQAAFAGKPNLTPLLEASSDILNALNVEVPKKTSPLLHEYKILQPYLAIIDEEKLTMQEKGIFNLYKIFFDANNNVSNGLLPKITLLGEQLYDWHSANPTVVFSTDASLNKQLIQLITAVKTHNPTMGTADLSADLSTVQHHYLPITEQLEAAFQAFRRSRPDCVECENETTRSKELTLFYARITETLTHQLTTGDDGKAVAKAKKQATEIANQLALLHDKTEHLRGHIPGSAPFWAMTGAAAGAVTCGSGCCAGSFFCLNEATALFGSLFGALVGKLGLKQPQETNEKKKQKANA